MFDKAIDFMSEKGISIIERCESQELKGIVSAIKLIWWPYVACCILVIILHLKVGSLIENYIRK